MSDKDYKSADFGGETAATAKGIDGLTRRLVEHTREQGKPMSEEAARKQAREIALKTNIDRGLK